MSRFVGPSASGVALAVTLLAPTAARAQDAVRETQPPRSSATAPSPPIQARTLGTEDAPRDPFVWRYPTFRTSEYIGTGVFGAMALAGYIIPTDAPSWSAENGLDSTFRDALRLDGVGPRKTADDISDLTLTLNLNYAAFDAAVVAWALRGKGSVAYQMAALNVEVFAVTAGVTALTKSLIARERPYSAECETDPVLRRTDHCEPKNVNVSFISGHSSLAFAAASVTCMHHAYLGLYKSPAADAGACIAAYGAAGATGVLRMMSDNHYATDVASGAAVGTLIGLGLPWLLHYRVEVAEDDAATHPLDDVSFTVIPGPTSASIVGVF